MTNEPQIRRSRARVRNLSAGDLKLALPPGDPGNSAPPAGSVSIDLPEALPADDKHLAELRVLLQTYGGVIYTGPPGTSKTHLAGRAAVALAGSETRVRFIQFHPSYQYEDFVQGYVPKDGGGFVMKHKHLLELAQAATDEPDLTHVLVIDELSRGDPARIFGEALTYVEKSKRGMQFTLASGETCAIPDNLVFLATMNPWDKGVDDVDAAFDRRFAKVAMDPSRDILRELLDDAGLDAGMRDRVISFFDHVQKRGKTNPYGQIGHTYFLGAGDEAALRRVWDHQLRFVFQKAYQLDPDGLSDITQKWEAIFAGAPAVGAADRRRRRGRDRHGRDRRRHP